MTIQSNFPAISPSLSLDFANVQALDPRITYTRASTATYYGTRTAKAEENLLTYSQEFDNASWSKANITVTANAAIAPDGTTTAEKIIETASTANHVIYKGISNSGQHVFSVYAKADERSIIAIQRTASPNEIVWFDLSAGTVGTQTNATGSIQSVGNSWYRCSLIAAGNATEVAIFSAITNGATSYTGDGTSGLFIWGAQLEQRSAVTAYTVTTTQPITNYIPVLESAASGVARFDHNPTTFESLGFLIEEQRTNLINYSEQFDNAYWTKQEVTILANQAIAPDGTLTGDKLIINATTATHQIYKLSVVASSVCATSIYAKADGVNTFQILDGAGGANGATFNLSSGTVTSVGTGSGVIQSVGNGWYRCISIATTTGFRIYCPTSSSVETGNGYSGIFIWGAQLEAGEFATSYIPTVASQVTRAADSASMTGTNFSSWFNNAEGTLYAEAQSNAVTAGTNRFFCDVTGTSGNRISLLTAFSAGQAGMYVLANSADQAYIIVASAQLLSSGQKVAGAYQTNSFQAVNNGTAGTQDTTGIVPLVSTIHFGGSGFSTLAAVYMSGTIKKFSYYPIRLTNAQLQAITG